MGASGLPEGDAEEGAIVAEINVTPLTDIFLVLLIIFMVTTTAVHDEGKNIDLPQGEVAEQTTPKGVTVEVTPLWLVTPNVFMNVADPSALLQVVVQHSLGDNLPFLAAANLQLGPPGSEFGGIAALQPPDSY